MKRRELGNIGEKLARDFLKKKGYRIQETNFRCRAGEIDIIARKKDYLVFIEVRTKSSISFGSPEESISVAKKERLIALALAYINDHENLPPNWRIDFIGIELDHKGKASRIEHIENAVESTVY